MQMTATAIVTGGSGGIGRECVRMLISNHDILVQYYSSEEAAESVVEEVNSDSGGGDATSYECDVSSPEEVRSMVDHTKDVFGSVDVLVNNAGVLVETPIPEMTTEHITNMLSVNLMGSMYCIQAVLPEMCKQGKGRIVNVSSTGGTRGSATAPAYSAAKAGMVGFTKAIARRYTADGVLTNAVAPSSVDTAMFPDDRRDEAAASFPQERLIRPNEVAEAVQFFATTSYISGKVLEVDGGKYA